MESDKLAIPRIPLSGISAYTSIRLPAGRIDLLSYIFVKLFVAGVLEQDSRHIHGVFVVRDHLMHESHSVAEVTFLVS